MKTIRFSDGTVMTFEEYRRLCLEDAQSIAEHGGFIYKLWRCDALICALSGSLLVAASGLMLCLREPLIASGAFVASIAMAICSARAFRAALWKQQDCLARRQLILDSLHAVEKMCKDPQ